MLRYSVTKDGVLELERVNREAQKGWESLQRMTERKRRKLVWDNRLRVAIPDESFESKRRLGLGVLNLKSRSAWRPPTH